MSEATSTAVPEPTPSEETNQSVETEQEQEQQQQPDTVVKQETVESDQAATTDSDSASRLFLDEALPSLEDKSVDQVASLIEQVANSVTSADVERQMAADKAEMAEMKQFMERAQAEGLLDDDEVDEDAEDGTILLKSKTGDYNPIMEAYRKKTPATGSDAKATSKAVESASTSPKNITAPTNESDAALLETAVLLHVPLSGEIDSNSVLRYAAAATQDALARGEAPIVPLLSMGMAVGFGKLTPEALKAAERTIIAWLPAAPRTIVYSDCDLQKRFDVEKFAAAMCSKEAIEVRSLHKQSKKPTKVDASHVVQANKAASMSAAGQSSGGGMKESETNDPAPNKTRINRFTRDENNQPVQEFPDGVAGYAADGRAIPIVNDGATFDPTLPNVMGDMAYRNKLLSTPKFDPSHWYYKRFDKLKYLVIGSMGPKNCNLKYDEYYMCAFGAASSKSDCAAIAKHVAKEKNCYHGKMFNLGVIPIGEWFAVAPPRFSKDATATYSNPLHREYMDAYINEQKRATVELEQRVLDDEVRARSKTNTLVNQLKEKQMNPGLAPSAAQAQHEIAAQRAANKAQDERRALAQAEADSGEQQQQAQTKRSAADRRRGGGQAAARARRRLTRGAGGAGRGRVHAAAPAIGQHVNDALQRTGAGAAAQPQPQQQSHSQRPTGGIKIE